MDTGPPDDEHTANGGGIVAQITNFGWRTVSPSPMLRVMNGRGPDPTVGINPGVAHTMRTVAPKRFVRLLAVMVGVVMMVTATGLVVAPAATSQEGRSVSVSPNGGLANDVVTVEWSGFRPTTGLGLFGVIILQCRANPTSLDDCFTDAPFPQLGEGSRQLGSTGPDGRGSTRFEVRPSANLPKLGCSESNPCSILVFENDGVPTPDGALHPTSVVAPITFARSQADCPPVRNFDVRIDGAASAAPLFYRWAADLCTAASPLIVDYTETSSTSGRENFLEGLVDMGITSQAASEAEVNAHPERGDFSYAPVGLTAVTVVTNMRNPLTGEQLSDIVLTPRLVARLITDSSVAGFLTDPELRRLNPGVLFPTVSTSTPLLRAERNATTRMVTSWIASDRSASQFIAGQDTFSVPVNSAYRNYPYPRDLFENVGQSSQFLPRTGQRAVALRMFYAVRPAGENRENTTETAFLGIVDLPTARRFGLAPARIVNAAGTPVAPTTESIMAGFSAMSADGNGVLSPNFASTDPNAYPLVKVDYAMVPAQSVTPERDASIAALLRYAVGAGQASMPQGYLPLPASLVERTEAVAAGLDPAEVDPTAPPTGVQDAGGGLGTASGSSGFSSSSFSGGRAVGSSGLARPLGASGASGNAAGSEEIAAVNNAGATDLVAERVLPALATTRVNMLLPMLLLIAGLGFVGWGAGEVRPALRRTRAWMASRGAS